MKIRIPYAYILLDNPKMDRMMMKGKLEEEYGIKTLVRTNRFFFEVLPNHFSFEVTKEKKFLIKVMQESIPYTVF